MVPSAILPSRWEDSQDGPTCDLTLMMKGASYDVEKARVESLFYFDVAELRFLKWLGKGAYTRLGWAAYFVHRMGSARGPESG